MMVPYCLLLIASFNACTQAKLPPTRKNRNMYSSAESMIGLGSKPVRSARSSFMVGRSVKVKMVASIADQSNNRRNASHGTPGWKYRRDVQSSTAQGEFSDP